MRSHDEDLSYHATHIRKAYRTKEKRVGNGQAMDVIACLREAHNNGSSENSPTYINHAFGRMKPHRRQNFWGLTALIPCLHNHFVHPNKARSRPASRATSGLFLPP